MEDKFMKNTSDILIIIGFVFRILCAVGCLIGMFVLFAFASPEAREAIIAGIRDGSITSSMSGTPEQQADLVIMGLRIGAIGCLVGMLFDIAVAVVSFVAMKKATLGLYIASLVLAILSGALLTLIGSIFGIVSVSEKPKEAY